MSSVRGCNFNADVSASEQVSSRGTADTRRCVDGENHTAGIWRSGIEAEVWGLAVRVQGQRGVNMNL
jgi:hypothetical protein